MGAPIIDLCTRIYFKNNNKKYNGNDHVKNLHTKQGRCAYGGVKIDQ